MRKMLSEQTKKKNEENA